MPTSEAIVTAEPTEWCPIYKWGQRSNKLYITIFVPCVDEQHVKVSLRPDAIDFTADRVAVFAGGKESHRLYKLHIDLYEDIDPDESKSFLRHDHVRLELVKKKSGTWETLQPPHVTKNPNERPDFDHVGQEEAEDEKLCKERPRVRRNSTHGHVTRARRYRTLRPPHTWRTLVAHREARTGSGASASCTQTCARS